MTVAQLKRLPLALVLTGALAAPAFSADGEKDWLELFNGENLDGWIIKIRGWEVGEDPKNTFRVEDGLLTASYDQYERFNDRFGHIFYEEPFSYYIVRVEYRFIGDQVPEGPGWAFRNNGIMFHAQHPDEMELDQAFPLSVEYQMLGGDGENERPTGNLCTPGIHVVMNGVLHKDHCTESDSATFHGDQWVTAEVEVHGSGLIRHRVNGEQVMEYSQPHKMEGGAHLSSGYIALQAESHPTQFRSVRLLNLKGCLDPEASNFRSYLIRHDQSSCEY